MLLQLQSFLANSILEAHEGDRASNKKAKQEL